MLLVCTYLDTVRTMSSQVRSACSRGTRQPLTAAHDSTTAAGRRQQRGSRPHRNPTTDDSDVGSGNDQRHSMRWPRAQKTHERHGGRANVHCHTLASVGGRGGGQARISTHRGEWPCAIREANYDPGMAKKGHVREAGSPLHHALGPTDGWHTLVQPMRERGAVRRVRRVR